MKIASFEFNLFGVKTYVVWDEKTHHAAIIDPGMSDENERSALAQFINRHNLKISHLINTHLHIDHTLGNDFVMEEYAVPTEACNADAALGMARSAQAQMFHLRGIAPSPLSIDHNLVDGDKIWLGDEYLEVIYVPGHSPGSIALYCPQSKFVITGDALFNGSIGRTDRPGGNHQQLLDSIRTRLFSLPPETIVYPGHGAPTSIGHETGSNPFFRR